MSNIDGTLVAQTARLRLRRLHEGDAKLMLDLLNQPSFIANIGDRGVRTLEAARGYIRDRAVASYQEYGFGSYLIVLEDSGESIGTCGLIQRNYLDLPDLGFGLLPQYWGKGYAVEAAQATVEHAKSLGHPRLMAIVRRDNKPSIRLLDKLGFVFERRFICPDDGELLDLLVR